MATRTVVTTTCDLPHQADQPNEPAASFCVHTEAGRFEVDLCQMHVERQLGPLVANGRKAPKHPGQQRRARG